MKTWPLPNSFEEIIPKKGNEGAFWQERAGFFNCGVDIFGPEGSEVVAIDEGVVIDIGKFSSADESNYLNTTFYVIVRTIEKINYKYAELGDAIVEVGQRIKTGEIIGRLRKMVNPEMFDENTPFSVRESNFNLQSAKLHLELYKAPMMEVRPYDKGLFMGEEKPKSLLDPNVYLLGLNKNQDIYKV